MDLKKYLRDFFVRYGKPIKVDSLMKRLSIEKKYVSEVFDDLYELEKEGVVICVDAQSYMSVPDDFYLYHGILNKSNSNQYYIKVDNCFITIKNVGTAKVGDVVFVSKVPSKKGHPKNFQGTVERVVRRENEKKNSNCIVKAILKKDGFCFYVLLDNVRIYIPKERLLGAFAGDLVNVSINGRFGSVIDVLESKHSQRVFKCVCVNGELKFIPIGPSFGFYELDGYKANLGDLVLAELVQGKLKYIKKLDCCGSVKDEVNALLVDSGFQREFSSQVLSEAQKIVNGSKGLDLNKRVDLRNLETFTIDPLNAKDLDDAISLQYENGIYHLYVHAANPSHYIKLNSSIFKEALKRCFSIYPTSNVIPMLPDLFSSGVCSLNENGDKLAITCAMDIDSDGKLLDFKIFKSVIRNNKQMDYDSVNRLLNGEDVDASYLPFYPTIARMQELADILEKNRIKRGSVLFDSEEKQFVLDSCGNPIDILEKQRGKAEYIIENFMLLANETTANYAFYLGLPYVYRNHEKPDLQKQMNLRHNLCQNGYVIQKIGNIANPVILQQFLKGLLTGKGKEERKVICEFFLKSMSRAFYDCENIGHYGLAMDCYGTITSPARRISDLINHMVLEEFLDNGYDTPMLSAYRELVGDICEYISEKQKSVDLLEQSINQLLLDRYAEKFVEVETSATILFINRRGIYIKDEHGLTGIIPFCNGMKLHEKSLYYKGFEYKVGNQIPVYFVEKKEGEFIFRFCKVDVKKKEKKRDSEVDGS